jgi:hypothetical protein
MPTYIKSEEKKLLEKIKELNKWLKQILTKNVLIYH